MKKRRVIAFYLPQFHPTPENDEWWGKGFTEWTNVGRAKPLFPKHQQPKIPSDLGYYDLRVPETRIAQAELAKEAGIDGFCYWHYWFEPGKELLQRPFNEVVASGKPDFPFCLAWANENWFAKLWDKDTRKDKLLAEQKYLGVDDYTKHFYSVLPAFKDERYIKQNGKPVFVIYKPMANKIEIQKFMNTWQDLAKKEGLPGICFIAHHMTLEGPLEDYIDMGFDFTNTCYYGIGFWNRTVLHKLYSKITNKLFKWPVMVSYKKTIPMFYNKERDNQDKNCPTIVTGWDHTPRSGARGCVYINESPDLFYFHAKDVLSNSNSPFVFLKSWNEWAEGNYLEPDLLNGRNYINAMRNAVEETK